MAEQTSRPTVIRRAPFHFGPGPQRETLVENPQDRFDMQVKLDSIDEKGQRWEANWRSPASGLLMSPKVFLQFDILVEPTRPISQLSQAVAGYGVDFTQAVAQGNLLTTADAEGNAMSAN